MARRILAGLALAAALTAVIAFLFLRDEAAQTAREEDPGRAPASIETAQAPVEAAPQTSSSAGSRSALPTEAVEAIAPGLELFVRAVDGKPAASAELVIFRGEEVLETATTDAQGLARFPARTGGAELAVYASGHAVTRAPIELEAGRRNVTLPDGAILSGRVLVDGATPSVPIEIHLESFQISSAISALPKSVFAFLHPALQEHGDRTAITPLGNQFAITDANGTFAFHGLLSEVRARLTWTGPYAVEGVGPDEDLERLAASEFPAPRTDIELRLTAGIELALRVVDAAGAAAPAARVEITCIRQNAPGKQKSILLGAADAQGRFRGLIGGVAPTELEVRIRGAAKEGNVLHKLSCPPDMRGVFDVGDLALAPSRALYVHAQEADGTPIIGALGLPLPSGVHQKARSNADGNFVLAVEPGDLRFQARALGFESKLVDVPPDASSIVVTLTRACLLEFTIPDYPGVDRRFLSVRVQGEPPILIDEARGSVPSLQSPPTGRREQQGAGLASYATSTDQDGRWRIAGLVPGIPLHAELTTPTGGVLARADIAPLARAERRTVALVVDRLPKSLRVHVQAPDRRPVIAALVCVKEPSDGAESTGTTDYSGSCTISQIYSERFTVRVDAEGFPTAYEYGLQ
ncbi:MAG TPA: hypothetical protein VK843_14030, partial [Planctomycetota bacterium]|nr:hypothetical protein [Planctomycetota bacterium]